MKLSIFEATNCFCAFKLKSQITDSRDDPNTFQKHSPLSTCLIHSLYWTQSFLLFASFGAFLVFHLSQFLPSLRLPLNISLERRVQFFNLPGTLDGWRKMCFCYVMARKSIRNGQVFGIPEYLVILHPRHGDSLINSFPSSTLTLYRGLETRNCLIWLNLINFLYLNNLRWNHRPLFSFHSSSFGLWETTGCKKKPLHPSQTWTKDLTRGKNKIYHFFLHFLELILRQQQRGH